MLLRSSSCSSTPEQLPPTFLNSSSLTVLYLSFLSSDSWFNSFVKVLLDTAQPRPGADKDPAIPRSA